MYINVYILLIEKLILKVLVINFWREGQGDVYYFLLKY